MKKTKIMFPKPFPYSILSKSGVGRFFHHQFCSRNGIHHIILDRSNWEQPGIHNMFTEDRDSYLTWNRGPHHLLSSCSHPFRWLQGLKAWPHQPSRTILHILGMYSKVMIDNYRVGSGLVFRNGDGMKRADGACAVTPPRPSCARSLIWRHFQDTCVKGFRWSN